MQGKSEVFVYLWYSPSHPADIHGQQKDFLTAFRAAGRACKKYNRNIVLCATYLKGGDTGMLSKAAWEDGKLSPTTIKVITRDARSSIVASAKKLGVFHPGEDGGFVKYEQ